MSITVLAGCGSAFNQKPTEVAIREPGNRLLGEPHDLREEGERDWEYAWLSTAAYEQTPAATAERKARRARGERERVACKDAGSILAGRGWVRWQGFPDPSLQKTIDEAHLRVEVWEKQADAIVVVAFGGTVFNNGKDWISNLRWFLPAHKDEYTLVVSEFAPAFAREFRRRTALPGNDYLIGAAIHSTGHSLGGGLAQQFAYALPTDVPIPRVSKVFAFDPSPVTGYFSVDASTRDVNREKLGIDRIYERGEILAIVRSVTSFFLPPSASAPTIRGIRYALFYPANPISGHSMDELACRLSRAIGRQDVLN